MRARKNVHYEVQAKAGKGWQIIGMRHNEKEAIAEAKTLKNSGGYHTVRVLRERFDPAQSTFRSSEIYFDGKRDKASKHADAPSVACWRPSDLYSFEGRRTIARLLQRELERWRITATELVHCPEHVERLEDSGTALQRGVQQIAIADAQAHGVDVQARVKQLYDIIKLASDGLSADWKKQRIPDLKPDGFDKLVARLEGDGRRTYLLNCALAGHLRSTETMREKIGVMLALVGADHPAWVLEVVDSFIAELMSGVRMVQQFIGDMPDLAAALGQIADLSQGRFKPHGQGVPPEAAVINALIAKACMPRTVRALEERLVQELSSPRWLTDGILIDELEAFATVRARLSRADDSMIGDDAALAALEGRCGRYLGSETITEFLNGTANRGETITRLVMLAPHLEGDVNRRKLANYLMPVLTAPETETHFVEDNGTVPERMKRLAELQRRMMSCGLTEMHGRQASEKLDEYCFTVLRNNEVLKRLMDIGDQTAAGIRLLRMCASRGVTEGRTGHAVYQLAMRLVGRDGFLDQYLAAAGDSGARSGRLREFKRLLVAAGAVSQQAA